MRAEGLRGGLWDEGLGVRVWDIGVRVWGLGVRVSGEPHAMQRGVLDKEDPRWSPKESVGIWDCPPALGLGFRVLAFRV